MPAVQAERILRDLAELWQRLANEPAKSRSGVLRACSMTLIVAVEDEADAANVEQTVPELMHEHPSRTIVLKPAPEESALESRVFAQCWMPFGSRQQICCEQIEITTPEDDLDRVSRVMAALVAPDLPVVLWTRGRRWFERQEFDRFYPLADKVIVDSCGFPDVESAFERMDALRSTRPHLGDLAWTRLTGWREMIAHAFEGRNSSLASALRNVTVKHYGEPTVSTYYLAAWLSRAMPDAAVGFAEAPGGPGQIAGVRLTGEGADVLFERQEGNAVQVSGATHLRTVVLPHASDYRSMREELTITGVDRTFEEVYRVAAELSRRQK